jgi:hypothetical protein
MHWSVAAGDGANPSAWMGAYTVKLTLAGARSSVSPVAASVALGASSAPVSGASTPPGVAR